MKATIDHFKQFLVYLASRGISYRFHSHLPRMRLSFRGKYFSFVIPTTVEDFDYLTFKVLPDKLGISSARFFPETVFELYKVYCKRKSLRDCVALETAC